MGWVDRKRELGEQKGQTWVGKRKTGKQTSDTDRVIDNYKEWR